MAYALRMRGWSTSVFSLTLARTARYFKGYWWWTYARASRAVLARPLKRSHRHKGISPARPVTEFCIRSRVSWELSAIRGGEDVETVASLRGTELF